MAELSAIKLPNNTTFTFKDVEARGTTELIVGTQTAATGAWTGNASFSTLEDGRSILYWLPYAGSGNATLNLTLSNNTTTGAINCYYGGTSRLTTHYGAGNVIRLTYRENVSIAGSSTLYTGWWAEGNYDTNTIVTADSQNGQKTGAQGIWSNSLVMRDGSGTYQNICTASNGTATSSNKTTDATKLANTNGFEVGSPVWYCASSYNANSNMSATNVLYDNYALFDARYSFNVTRAVGQLTPFLPVYLVGTIRQPNGLFYLDDIWWTQTPNDESKIYVLVGGCYDCTTDNIRINLNLENTWYKYNGTRLVPMQSLGGGDFSNYVKRSGDTMTGNLAINSTPSYYLNEWTQGTIGVSDGENKLTWTTRCFTPHSYNFDDAIGTVLLVIKSGYKVGLRWYSGYPTSTSNYVGYEDFQTGTYSFTPTSGYYYRFVVADTSDGTIDTDTVPSDVVLVSVNPDSVLLRETDDHRGAIYVKGPTGCGDAILYSNTNGSAELDIRNANQQTRVGMNISTSGDGTVFLRDSSNALATIQKADVDKWNSIIDTIYPVGSLYITLNNDDPSIRLGGSWIKLDTTGRFILSSSSSYPVSEVTVSTDGEGQTTYSITNKGGEATHTLTVDEMPSHNHLLQRVGSAFSNTSNVGLAVCRDRFSSSDNRMDSTGGGQAHNNMPPYFTAHIWYRYA